MSAEGDRPGWFDRTFCEEKHATLLYRYRHSREVIVFPKEFKFALENVLTNDLAYYLSSFNKPRCVFEKGMTNPSRLRESRNLISIPNSRKGS